MARIYPSGLQQYKIKIGYTFRFSGAHGTFTYRLNIVFCITVKRNCYICNSFTHCLRLNSTIDSSKTRPSASFFILSGLLSYSYSLSLSLSLSACVCLLSVYRSVCLSVCLCPCVIRNTTIFSFLRCWSWKLHWNLWESHCSKGCSVFQQFNNTKHHALLKKNIVTSSLVCVSVIRICHGNHSLGAYLLTPLFQG